MAQQPGNASTVPAVGLSNVASHRGPQSLSLDRVGITVDPQYAAELRQKINSMLNWSSDSFPGWQPITFQQSHLLALEREDYFVCEKSDGVRYMMLLLSSPKPAIFLVDRKYEFQYLDLRFPLPSHEQNGPETLFHHDTLLDGELVIETDGSNTYRKYIVFDLMYYNGDGQASKPLTTRLGFYNSNVLQPHAAYLQRHPEWKHRQPFWLGIKKLQRAYGLNVTLNEEIPKLKHRNDGLIFTPVHMPYTPGTCEKLLKWKSPENTTVDFKIKILYDADRKPHYQLLIAESNQHVYHDDFTPEPELAQRWRPTPPDGQVAEFKYDKTWRTHIYEPGYTGRERLGGWRFVRFRDDKNMANDITTVESSMAALEHGVTTEMLISRCESIRSHWKAREASGALPPRAPDRRFSSVIPSTPATEHPPAFGDDRRNSTMIGRDSTSVHTGHRRSGSLGTGSESSGTPHRKVSGHHRTISVDNSRNVTGQTPVRSPRRSSPYSITGPPASGVLSPREARRLSASSPIQERRKSQDTAAGQEPEPEANFAETNPENEAVSPRKRSLQDLNLPKGIRLRKVPSNSGTMNMMSSADTEGDPALMSEAVNPTLPTPVAEKSLGHGVYSSDTAVPAADSLSRGEACPAAMDIDDSANTLTDRTQVQQTSPLPPQEAADTAEPMDLSRPPSPPESITHVGAMPPADGASMVKRSSSNPPEPSMRPNHMNVDMLTSPETSKSPKGMSEFGHSRHQSPPHQLEQEPVGHAPLAKPEDSDIKPSSIAQPSVTARGPKSPTKMKSKAKGTGLSWLTKPEDTEAIVSAATARVSPARSRKLSNKRGKGLSTARSGTVTSAHPPPPSPQPPPVVELPKPPVVLMQAKRKVEDDDVYDEEESPVATPSPMAELVLKQPLVVIPTEPSPPKGPAILAAKSKAEASPKRKSRKKKDTIEKGIPTQQQPPSNSSHVIHQSSHQAQSTHRRTMSAPKIDPGMETLATAAMLAEKQQEHDLHSRRRASLAGTAYAPQGHVGVGSAHAPIPASYSMYAIGPGEHPSHRRHPSQHQLPHSQPLPAHHRPPSPQGPPHSQLPPHYYYPGHPAAPAGPDQRRYSAVQPVGHPYAYPPQHRGSVPQGVPLVPMHPGHPYWPGPGGRGPYYLPFPPPDGSAYPRYGAAQQSPQVQPGMPAAQDHRQRGYYDVNGHGHGDRESVSKRPTIAPHGYPTEEHREYPQQHTDSSAATNTTGVNQQSERHSTVPTKRRSAWLDVVLGDDA